MKRRHAAIACSSPFDMKTPLVGTRRDASASDIQHSRCWSKMGPTGLLERTCLHRMPTKPSIFFRSRCVRGYPHLNSSRCYGRTPRRRLRRTTCSEPSGGQVSSDAGLGCQQRPAARAELRLPLLVDTAEHPSERRLLDEVERRALLRERCPQLCIQCPLSPPLQLHVLRHVPLDDGLHVGRQSLPGCQMCELVKA